MSLQGLTGVDVTDDSSLIAGGFADSTVRVWSVTPKKLRKVKSAAGTATRVTATHQMLLSEFLSHKFKRHPPLFSSARRLKCD